MIGKIQRLPLREVWRHEAHDFTTWLQDNLDVLSDVLDLNLTNAEREQPAGAFSVDLVAEDEAGDPVVIEKLLEWVRRGTSSLFPRGAVRLDTGSKAWGRTTECGGESQPEEQRM